MLTETNDVTPPPVVIWRRNAFMPDRDFVRDVLPEPMTVHQWMGRHGVEEFPGPTLCLINGDPVLRAEWSARVIWPGDLCVLIALPHRGGGGGGGGKNPLKTILMFAVMVAAPELAGIAFPGMAAAAAAEGATLGARLAFGAIKAGFALAGSALVNVLVPDAKAAAPSVSWSGGGVAASPVYSLSPSGNSARLGQPLPVGYGRHQYVPDLAAPPYSEYVNNDEYLYQLFVIGCGHYAVEDVRIDDTPIGQFAEVQMQLAGPGEAVTLFDASVATAVEVSGQELPAINEAGGWVGPFRVVPSGARAVAIGIDVVMPRGLYYAADSGGLEGRSVAWMVEARQIDDDGVPVGAWTVLATETVWDNHTTPIRLSYRYPVSAARWEVRMRRTDARDFSSRAGHELRWGQARAYLQDAVDLAGLTVLAVKMRATNNLSERSSRSIRVLATRRLPIWDRATRTWSAPQPTRSIAWALADILRADYGARQPDRRIDLDGLAELDAIWAARGDYFDGIFDTSETVWGALTSVARCGRAVPVQSAGVVRIVRNGPLDMPTLMLSARDIVRGSFRMRYICPGEETADAVTVEYISPQTWGVAEVTERLPGSTETNPARRRLLGSTSAAHARREALYMAAANAYGRRIVTVQTELDGMIPTYGDGIAISHDMPRWGQCGEVVEYQPDDPVTPLGGGVLVLSEPVDWSLMAGSPMIGLRRQDGSPCGAVPVAAAGDDPCRVRVGPLPILPYTGGEAERTRYAIGGGAAWSRIIRVTAVRPRGGRVEITGMVEDPRIHVN